MEKGVRVIGRKKHLNSLCMKGRGLSLNISFVSMIGFFPHVCIPDRAEDFVFLHSKIMLFTHITVRSPGEEYVPIIHGHTDSACYRVEP